MKFTIYNNEQISKAIKYISELPLDKRFIVDIYEAKKKRGLSQNNLWHKWIDLMAKEAGCSPSDMKVDVKRQILGMKESINLFTGEVTYKDYSSADLTKEQFSRLMIQTQVLASEYYGMTLPSPDEATY